MSNPRSHTKLGTEHAPPRVADTARFYDILARLEGNGWPSHAERVPPAHGCSGACSSSLRLARREPPWPRRPCGAGGMHR